MATMRYQTGKLRQQWPLPMTPVRRYENVYRSLAIFH